MSDKCDSVHRGVCVCEREKARVKKFGSLAVSLRLVCVITFFFDNAIAVTDDLCCEEGGKKMRDVLVF